MNVLLNEVTSVPPSSEGQGLQSLCSLKPNTVVYVHKKLSKSAKRKWKCCGICCLIAALLCFILVFVGIPIIFMNSITLQRLIIFTNWNLPSDQTYFDTYELKPGLKNFYVPVKDKKSNKTVFLGVWHLLPYTAQPDVITEDPNYDFDGDLRRTDKAVLLYFHGTGEDRSSARDKYRIFRFFAHVITFDYRNYGDSSDVELSEDGVVNDCVQLYEWLISKTDTDIYLWGHSLGTALAAHTALILSRRNIRQPVGLVLEAAFTKMSEELKVHPYGKIFAWLPWFNATILKPLEKNGFIFDTSDYIKSLEYPIMILCSEDDNIVPYHFGRKLHDIAQSRENNNISLYYQFPGFLQYQHNFIYKDPFLPFFISYFRHKCTGDTNQTIDNPSDVTRNLFNKL